MRSLFQRLLAGGAAYQASSVLSAVLALVTLPLYTRALTRADFGIAETLLTFIILASILLRLGLGEAFVRFYFQTPEAQRDHLARTTTATVLLVTTIAALLGALLAGPLSVLLLGFEDAGLMRIALLGLWSFTNLEIAYALLRVEERRRTYVVASLCNVLLTVALTVALVVALDGGARGYLAGNYVASTVVLLGLWWLLRSRIGPRIGGEQRLPLRPLRPLLAFGVPTVPADATVFALNVVDRAYILRTQSAAAAGLFALSVKLATAVILAVRGFQLAWPPLAYSIGDDREAGRFYAAVATWYVVLAGYVVAGLTLLGRWVVRLLAAPEYFAAHEALPWVALGWAMYGLFLVLVTIGGRAGVTTRTFPAALAGVVVNGVVLVALVGPLGIAGAGIALVAAYAVMLVVLHLLTRGLFAVPFQWRRLVHAVVLLAGVSVAGELLLAPAGVEGFLLRTGAAALIPVLFAATRFVAPEELAGLRRLLASRRPRRAVP
ncbi:MAG TPA: lipopolysaccharide biosynthesis protein [Solirubrobacteraceae bacterium]|nr:lipopolysaccharide biosynthesis protein [Solirubrobacteraceae bacterium]